MATTGSIFAAWDAGIMPARIPATIQIIIAIKIIKGERKKGKSIKELATLVRINTRSKPIIPPIMQRKADSNKNSIKMTLLLAPIAFLRPIWDVLSLTVTNIILATPNMPTINARAPIAHPPILTLTKAFSSDSLRSLISFKAKLSS
jgi:hypothetical protein